MERLFNGGCIFHLYSVKEFKQIQMKKILNVMLLLVFVSQVNAQIVKVLNLKKEEVNTIVFQPFGDELEPGSYIDFTMLAEDVLPVFKNPEVYLVTQDVCLFKFVEAYDLIKNHTYTFPKAAVEADLNYDTCHKYLATLKLTAEPTEPLPKVFLNK